MIPKTILPLLLLLAPLLGLTAASPQPFSNNYCPTPADILPCVCTETLLHLDMDCSDVKSDAELQAAFQAAIPFTIFRKLTIIKKLSENRVPITTLNDTTFASLSFTEIRISHTNLVDIAPNTFRNSLQGLEILIVTDSFLTSFPFDILVDCPVLTDLRVFKNRISHMSNIRSNSLTYLQVSQNPELRFEDQAFYSAPHLEYLLLNDIGLPHIAADLFSKQVRLKYLDLSHNLIEILYKDSLAFILSPIQQIKLDGNRIHTVQKDAISGLPSSHPVNLFLQHNHLTNLTQEVWKPIFQSVDANSEGNLFVLDDNPLICGCNILWLVSQDSYMDTLAEGAWCPDTEQLIHDIDVEFLEENC